MNNWQGKVSPPKTSGSIFSPQDEPPSVIMLVTGEDAGGKPQWAYVKIPASNYAAFKEAEAKGNYCLADFGEILESGRSRAPAENIRQKMKEQYGCDETFEASFAQMMQEAIEAWDEVLKEAEKP